MLAWTGGLINGVQTLMYGLATHVYPAAIRATGVGTAVAVGRVGGIGSPVRRRVGARVRAVAAVHAARGDAGNDCLRGARRGTQSHSVELYPPCAAADGGSEAVSGQMGATAQSVKVPKTILMAIADGR